MCCAAFLLIGGERRQAGQQNFASNANMTRLPRIVPVLLTILVFSALVRAGTPGSFRGTVVDGPGAGKGQIYVQGRNGMARRVDISRAQVSYDESVPETTRLPRPEDALTPGAEVRVTAEQGDDGEWRASRIEILKEGSN
jgi:hypothetical protein